MHKVTSVNTWTNRHSFMLKYATEFMRCQPLMKDNGDEHKLVTNQNKRLTYTPDENVSLDDPPTTCCMSGCSNCVYILWAEALTKRMTKADPIIAKKILENVEDPGMQAFLKMELRNIGLIK